ncbi:MAG: flagellar biosynthesis anti-sigma factor FlgM [Planctomycetales bacterium]|nr:flagellar biosynthesis anti-sigma factor FlgM [Planctomycetales bacterium]
MQIYGPSHIHAAQNSKGPHSSRTSSAGSASRPQAADSVDISAAAEAALEASETDGVRADLVARIRGEIASGSYETPEKMDAALDRLLDAIG